MFKKLAKSVELEAPETMLILAPEKSLLFVIKIFWLFNTFSVTNGAPQFLQRPASWVVSTSISAPHCGHLAGTIGIVIPPDLKSCRNNMHRMIG